jgi:hypothetical protein
LVSLSHNKGIGVPATGQRCSYLSAAFEVVAAAHANPVKDGITAVIACDVGVGKGLFQLGPQALRIGRLEKAPTWKVKAPL